jgi:tripartite-type tricarboxylate transporter receptor subunit TctC
MTFNALTTSIEYIKAGKVRPLAVTTAVRSEALPDVPSIGDFVPGYEASAINGLAAPANTPARLSRSLIPAALRQPASPAVLAPRLVLN